MATYNPQQINNRPRPAPAPRKGADYGKPLRNRRRTRKQFGAKARA